MIFVNYGGGGYWFFSHSRWHGLTVADLVMPWFMFMMGVSFTFSLKSLDRRGSSKRQMMMKVLLRCIKLFVIGLFLINQSDSWNGIRLPGVLQRFAICYLVGKHVHNRILISWLIYKSRHVADIHSTQWTERWYLRRYQALLAPMDNNGVSWTFVVMFDFPTTRSR